MKIDTSLISMPPNFEFEVLRGCSFQIFNANKMTKIMYYVRECGGVTVEMRERVYVSCIK